MKALYVAPVLACGTAWCSQLSAGGGRRLIRLPVTQQRAGSVPVIRAQLKVVTVQVTNRIKYAYMHYLFQIISQ